MKHLISSPHIKNQQRTARVMQWVILSTLPGLFALTWVFGWGSLIQVCLCVSFAVIGEACVALLRKRSVAFYLGDYSAVVTGLLLGLALPPFAPWWIACVGGLFSIVFSKQLYGGLGQNPFNPAMAGYALLLVSFPVEMSTLWAQAQSLTPDPAELPGFSTTLEAVLVGGSAVPDAFTAATPLDVYKHEIPHSTQAAVMTLPVFQAGYAGGWEWVNLGFLAGGLILLWRRIITWHIPVSFLAALGGCSLLFGWDPDQSTPLGLHLLGGATMLGAWFIATDPSSAATSTLGKLWYGAGIGALVFMIRAWGGYPDGVAFAVLLMNLCAPFIDYYTQPRVYGHQRRTRGLQKDEVV